MPNIEPVLELGQLDEQQAFPPHTQYALYLGTETANICKHAFYIYDSICRGAVVKNIIVLGNNEPYGQYMEGIQRIILQNKHYFKEGISADHVPMQASLHEAMYFIVKNLNWPEDKQPNFLRLQREFPRNTREEIELGAKLLSMILPQQDNKAVITTLFDQPFNDHQRITMENAFNARSLQKKVHLEVAGPARNIYPELNDYPAAMMPAAMMSPAQIINKLTIEEKQLEPVEAIVEKVAAKKASDNSTGNPLTFYPNQLALNRRPKHGYTTSVKSDVDQEAYYEADQTECKTFVTSTEDELEAVQMIKYTRQVVKEYEHNFARHLVGRQNHFWQITFRNDEISAAFMQDLTKRTHELGYRTVFAERVGNRVNFSKFPSFKLAFALLAELELCQEDVLKEFRASNGLDLPLPDMAVKTTGFAPI